MLSTTLRFSLTIKQEWRCFSDIRKTVSEVSYIYILSGQKLIKSAKMVNLASFWNLVAVNDNKTQQ